MSRLLAATTTRRSEQRAGILLAGPALTVFAVFMFWPLLLTAWYSLHRYSGFGSLEWLAGDNYRRLASDPTFWRSLANTVVFVVTSVPLGLALGLGAALLLDRAMPARALWRALFYVPVVVSGVAAGVVFLRLFDPITGLFNQLLTGVGLPGVDWQGDGTAAFVSVVLVTTWQGFGFSMVVYLAALQGIPREVREAAQLDGAVGVRSFRWITWPMLGPTTFFLLVYSVITSFQVFDVVYVLTRGGPGTDTTFLVQYAYDQGFTQREQGYAAAIGVVLYVIVLALTAVYWRAAQRRDEA